MSWLHISNYINSWIVDMLISIIGNRHAFACFASRAGHRNHNRHLSRSCVMIPWPHELLCRKKKDTVTKQEDYHQQDLPQNPFLFFLRFWVSLILIWNTTSGRLHHSLKIFRVPPSPLDHNLAYSNYSNYSISHNWGYIRYIPSNTPIACYAMLGRHHPRHLGF